MLGLFFELELAWGFGVRYPKGTAVQMAPPLPPPSTAIGAVAENVAIRLGLGETVKLGKKKVCSTAYVFAKAAKGAAFALSPDSPTGIAVRAELMRILQASYLDPNNRKNPEMWFGAQAFAHAYGPKALVQMMVVFDEHVLEKELKALGVNEDPRKLLEDVTIRRIGSKEGIVATKKKVVDYVTKEKDVESYFYAKKKSVKKMNKKYVTEILLWEPKETTFCGGTPKYEIFVVPSGPFSSQAVLTPPEKKMVISKAFCLKEYCVEMWN